MTVVLQLTEAQRLQIVGHCLEGLPDEACGLLVGSSGSGLVQRSYPSPNLAQSAKLYRLDGKVFMRAERDADAAGLEVMGVYHSHTHTDAYPSPTDVDEASTPMSDPRWHYLLVSLRDLYPVLRSYRIVERRVHEEPVVVVGAG